MMAAMLGLWNPRSGSSFPVMLFMLACLSGVRRQAHALCTPPTDMQGTWFKVDDSATVVISSTGVTLTDPYNCHQSSENQYVFVTQTSMSGPTTDMELGYFCWEMIQVSEVTYLLYDLTALTTTGAFAGKRIKGVVDTLAAPSLSAVCSLSSDTVAPTLLYKSPGGTLSPITEAEQLCSPELYHTFSYVTGAGDCTGSDSQLDFCHDRSTARVNYAACTTKVLYSEDGLLSCLANVTVGSDVYQLLYNQDASPDGSTYYRFVCMKVTDTEATVYPENCAVTPDANKKLTLTITESCPITDDSGGGTDPVPIIVGVVVSVVLIALIVVIVILLYKLVYLKRKASAVTPVSSSDKPVPNGNSAHASAEEGATNLNEGTVNSNEGENTPNGPEAAPSTGTRLPPLESSNTPRTEPLRQ